VKRNEINVSEKETKNGTIKEIQDVVQDKQIYTTEVVEQEEIETEEYIDDNQSVDNIEVTAEDEPIYSNEYTTRLTSYYNNDGYETGSCTGSGLCESDFQVNENGWYTYQGKLVIATATDYLLKYGYTLYDGVHSYKYYDELTLNIDGIDYQAIVTDSCGNCMKTGRIDLFVSGSNYVKDTEITVKE
jgi:hypothetical protein